MIIITKLTPFLMLCHPEGSFTGTRKKGRRERVQRRQRAEGVGTHAELCCSDADKTDTDALNNNKMGRQLVPTSLQPPRLRPASTVTLSHSHGTCTTYPHTPVTPLVTHPHSHLCHTREHETSSCMIVGLKHTILECVDLCVMRVRV